MYELKLEEFEWEELYDFWIMKANIIVPELLEPVPFEHIKFRYDNDQYKIYGYDWIHKNVYKSRIKSITNNPSAFLWLGESLNKGTLQTAEYLAEAKDNEEKLSLIWLYSFVRELLDDLPTNLRGKSFRTLKGMEIEIISELKRNDMHWHHAMRKLIPDNYYFDYIYDDINVISYESVIELAIINAKLVNDNYKVVLYDSYNKEE